jgi:hypothetical protein
MRKMWAAGAAIVACLALGALPVAGQEASPVSAVTGVDSGSTAVNIHIDPLECVEGEPGTVTYANGVRQLRGWTRHCRYDAYDPRFSGWSDIVHNADCYSEDRSKCIMWGTERASVYHPASGPSREGGVASLRAWSPAGASSRCPPAVSSSRVPNRTAPPRTAASSRGPWTGMGRSSLDVARARPQIPG